MAGGDEAKLGELVLAMPTPVVLARRGERVLAANAAARELLGWSADELRAMRCGELCDPLDPRAGGAMAAPDGGVANVRVRRKNGSTFEAEVACVVVPSDTSLLWIGLRDLTETRRAARMAGRFRAAIEASPERFYLLEAVRDPASGAIVDFRFVEANSAAVEQAARRNRSEILGRCVRDAFPELHALGLVEKLTRVVETGVPLIEEFPAVFDGEERWFHHRVVPLGGWVASAVSEVTDRRRAEEALRIREAELIALSNATREALFIHDKGVILATNAAARELYRLPEDGAVGRLLLDFVAPEALAEVRRRIQAQSAEPYDSVARRADGTTFPATVQARTVTFRGTPARIAAIRDLSEERRLQASLAFADRMASIGTLAAGVAHEINNPLAFVTLGLDLAIRMLSTPGISAEDTRVAIDTLRDAEVGAKRVQAIVRDLKTFSRGADEDVGAVQLGPVIDYAARIALAEIKHRARLVLDVGGVPPVQGNEARLGQVFLNLLINAAHAIQPGAADRHEIAVNARAQGELVVVTVSDTGAGLSPDTIGRIFEPFVTTKSHGTGLGLAICHDIVTRLGGTITVESALGRGATFTVQLPIATADDRAASHGAGAPVPATRPRARILLVDDEVMLRSITARLLAPDHDVVAAASGHEALARLEAGERFDAALCDLLMPEMTGMELHARVGERWPELAKRFAFMTGGVFTPEAAEFVEATPQPCIDKPFSLATLTQVIDEVLRR